MNSLLLTIFGIGVFCIVLYGLLMIRDRDKASEEEVRRLEENGDLESVRKIHAVQLLTWIPIIIAIIGVTVWKFFNEEHTVINIGTDLIVVLLCLWQLYRKYKSYKRYKS